MAALNEFVDSVLFLRRQQGWKPILAWSILPFFEFHRAYVKYRPLDEPIEVPPLEPAFTIRPATTGDLFLFDGIVPRLRVKRFLNKIQAGELCMMALHGGEMVGYVWSSFAGTPTTADTPFRLSSKEAYAWGVYVHPQCRSQGIASALLLSMYRRLHKKGFERIYGISDQKNKAIDKAARKVGQIRIAEMISFRFFGWTLAHFTPLVTDYNKISLREIQRVLGLVD